MGRLRSLTPAFLALLTAWACGGNPSTTGGSSSAGACEPGDWCESHITDATFAGVWGSSARDVWVSGNENGDSLLHWDGGSWSLSSTGTGMSTGYGVWGSGPGDIWTLGDDQSVPTPTGQPYTGQPYTAVLHRTGSVWSVATASVPGLEAVSGCGPQDVWVVGSADSGDAGSPTGIAMHWDGQSWSTMTVGDATLFLESVWCSQSNDVWAVGWASVTSGTPIVGAIAHWNGISWSITPQSGSDELTALWGSRPDDLWAVGGHVEATEVEPNVWTIRPRAVVMHWDGGAWSAPVSVGDGQFEAVWGSGSADVWAVGAGGLIAQWDGSGWSTVPSGTAAGLNGVWGSSSDQWTVGQFGTILHRSR